MSELPNMTAHHFEETIGGRVYHVEVVGAINRWRANLRCGPGMPTAVMPFYGRTPSEAAELLLRWLTRAHATAVGSAAAEAPTGST